MNKNELTEQIGKINLKMAAINKELKELALEFKRKKLELMQYRNRKYDIQLELQRLALEEFKTGNKSNKETKRMQEKMVEKYSEDPNNEYYSQEKYFSNDNDLYAKNLVKNIVPYND